MYHPSNRTANFPLSPLSLNLEAQGGLFKVALAADTKRQQSASCARDHALYANIYARVFAQHAQALPFVKQAEKDTRLIVSGNFAANFSQAELDEIEHETQEQQWVALRRPRAHRARICAFSAKSRLRLLQVTARLKPDVSGLFITFTYRQNMQDHQRAKYHLDLMLRWLKYNYPQAAFVWRMEYQARGAIHFHILAFNVKFIDAQELTTHWQSVSYDQSYPDVERIQNRRKALYYVSKYTAKSARTPCAHALAALAFSAPRLALLLVLLVQGGFIYVPYSEKSFWVGRFWGVVNRAALPFAPLTRAHVTTCAAAFHDLRRAAHHRFPRLRRALQGYTLFCDNALRWLTHAAITCRLDFANDPITTFQLQP